MFQWLLFLHIVCVAFWLGSIAAVFILYRKSLASQEAGSVALAHETTRSVIRGVVNPCALVVLVTGIVMIVQLGLGQAKPLWLTLMERGGGMLVLLSLALLSWQLRKLTNAPAEPERRANLGRLVSSLAGIGVGVLGIILVVALRIG